MISKRPDGKLQYETWRDRAPGFSAPQMYTDQKPETLLEGLAPPVGAKASSDPAAPSISIGKPMSGPEETPWYERRWVQASAAAGVAAIIVGVILYARRGENVAINHDIMSGM
jgi:hypothetical protein